MMCPAVYRGTYGRLVQTLKKGLKKMEAENKRGSKARLGRHCVTHGKLRVTKVVDERMRLPQNKAKGRMS